MAQRARWRILLLTAAVAGRGATAALAETGCSAAKPGELLAAAIGIAADASLPPGVLETALASWRGCPNAGTGFPQFAEASRDLSVVRVRYVAASSRDRRCGYFAGSEIVLFASALDRLGRTVPCGALAANLAHELGYALGLADAPAGARCGRYIMAGDDFRPGRERSVQPQECAAADAHWLTPAEGAMLVHSWRRVEGEANAWLADAPVGPGGADGAAQSAPAEAFALPRSVPWLTSEPLR